MRKEIIMYRILSLCMVVSYPLYSMESTKMLSSDEHKLVDELLYDAFYGPDRDSFNKALELGFCVNTPYNSTDVTPLGDAVISYCSYQYSNNQQKTLLSIIEELLKRGANPNVCSVHAQSKKDGFEKYAVEIGKGDCGLPVLFCACSSVIITVMICSAQNNPSFDLVALLLRYGLSKHELDKIPQTLCKFTYEDLIKMLPETAHKPCYMDTVKTWYLLFPEKVELALERYEHQTRQRLLAECKEAMESVATLTLQKRKMIDQCGGILNYLVAAEIGGTKIFIAHEKKKEHNVKENV